MSTLLSALDIGKATGYVGHAERLAVPFTENLVATQHNHLKEIVELTCFRRKPFFLKPEKLFLLACVSSSVLKLIHQVG